MPVSKAQAIRIAAVIAREKKRLQLADFAPYGVTERRLRTLFGGLKGLVAAVKVEHPHLAIFAHPGSNRTAEKFKADLIALFKKYQLQYGYVTSGLFVKHGFSSAKICHLFGSMLEFRQEVRKRHPEVFSDIELQRVLTIEKETKLKRVASSKKRFVIVSAGIGDPILAPFYKSLKQYCKTQNAELIVMLTADPASVDEASTIAEELADEHIVTDQISFNKNLCLSNIKVSSKQLMPLTGLGRLTHAAGASVIVASPKQMWTTVPGRIGTIPRIAITTGAVTLPHYEPKKRMRWGLSDVGAKWSSGRLAYLAEQDHIMGALLVDVESDVLFHPRHVQADADGAFIDFGVKYTPTGSEKVTTPYLVAGDIHSGFEDKPCLEALVRVGKKLRIEHIVVHDLFDGYSISPHDETHFATLAKKCKAGQLSLACEAAEVVRVIRQLLTGYLNIDVVTSNHDEWLERWIESGRYAKDPVNKEVAATLVGAVINKTGALRALIEPLLTDTEKRRISWHKRTDEFKYKKIQLGFHGDKGINGARGSIHQFEAGLGRAVIAHNHSAGKYRGVTQVGTSSLLQRDYNEGTVSSWIHSHCLVNSDGSTQLFNTIDGKTIV